MTLKDTVEPRLIVAPLIRPPRDYGYLTLAGTKAQSGPNVSHFLL